MDKAEEEAVRCEICEEPTDITYCCEVCARAYGSCCNSLRDGLCIDCTDGGSDDGQD